MTLWYFWFRIPFPSELQHLHWENLLPQRRKTSFGEAFHFRGVTDKPSGTPLEKSDFFPSISSYQLLKPLGWVWDPMSTFPSQDWDQVWLQHLFLFESRVAV